MIEYSICFPYCLRLPLLKNTLQSFRDQYSYRRDYEVSIAVDPKSFKELPELESLVKEHDEIPIRLIKGEHGGISFLWNLAVNSSQGKYVMLQSPETMHACDCLSCLDDFFHLDTCSYIIFAVQNIDANGKILSWYQHSKVHNRQLHFLSAMSRENWNKIRGMDEEFDRGCCYDDDMFLAIVKYYNIKIQCIDEYYGQHQNHSHLNWGKNRSSLVAKNKLLYQHKLARLRKGEI